MQPPHVITISVFRSFSCAHACFMGLVMPSEYAQNYEQPPHLITMLVFQSFRCAHACFLSCHPVSIPLFCLCSFVIVASTLFRGLVLLNMCSQYGRRAGPLIWTVALHGFVFGQGPEILYIILPGTVYRQDRGGMHRKQLCSAVNVPHTSLQSSAPAIVITWCHCSFAYFVHFRGLSRQHHGSITAASRSSPIRSTKCMIIFKRE